MDWWANRCEPGSVCDQYWDYIGSVRGALADSIIQFLDKHTLHDSTVRKMSVDLHNHALRIAADGFDVRLELRVVYELEYAGVVAVVLLGEGSDSLPGSAGLGDLGYDEFEPLGSDVFEHRLLFSSGVEISIRFRDFRFTARRGGQMPDA